MLFKIKRLWRILAARKSAYLFIFAVILIFTAVLYSSIYNSIVPENAYQLLKQEAISHIDQIIDETVKDHTENMRSTLLNPTYDGKGELISYTADTAEFERTEAEISKKIMSQLKKKSAVKLRLPIGSLTDNKYLSGKGFKITISGETVPSVTTSITTEVIDSGINQTLYRVKLCTTVSCCVIYSGKSEEVKIRTEHILSERIIMGKVPLSDSR